jgi:hypothetical protein
MVNDKKLWKVLIRALSFENQPTKVVLTQTYMGAFFIRSVSDTIFCNAFSSETACGPPLITVRETLA